MSTQSIRNISAIDTTGAYDEEFMYNINESTNLDSPLINPPSYNPYNP